MSKPEAAPAAAAAAAPSPSSSSSSSFVDSAYEGCPSRPPVVSDPRFRAGRRLVASGRAGEGAIGMFATLVEESRRKYGESSVESAPCYYEYGNALFRAAVRRKAEEEEEEEEEGDGEGEVDGGDGDDEDRKPAAAARSAAAEAAERRAAAAAVPVAKKDTANGEERSVKEKGAAAANGAGRATTQQLREDAGNNSETKAASGTVPRTENDGGEPDSGSRFGGGESDDDATLALELMENAWSILDRCAAPPEEGGASAAAAAGPASNPPSPYTDFARSQLPRTLGGIGDVLSHLGRHPDAADAYSRSLAHREREVEELTTSASSSSSATLSSSSSRGGGVEELTARRRLVEANVLVAEEFLACPEGRDVVTSETGDVLCRSDERVEYARGYYDKAREGLQEAVFLMGKLAGEGGKEMEEEIGRQKEDVCYLATMVMGVGTTLAELDEEEEDRKDTEERCSPKKRRIG